MTLAYTKTFQVIFFQYANELIRNINMHYFTLMFKTLQNVAITMIAHNFPGSSKRFRSNLCLCHTIHIVQ